MNEQLALGLQSWTVIERISPRARNIRIEIHSADRVVLVIPRFCARSVAREFLQSRMPWVLSKIQELADREPQVRAVQGLRWDGSDQVMLRGEEVALRLVAASVQRPAVRIDDAITVLAKPAQLGARATLHAVLLAALKAEARRDAQRYIAAEAPRLHVQVNSLRIADQKSLWGSCTRAGGISLNWRLLLAPSEVFRYVVVHELAHLVHHDHSARFWALVARQMPTYEASRIWLREHGGALHRMFASA